MYAASLKNLEEIGININETFLSGEKVEVPLLRGIHVLLQSIGTKGLKLTQKGFLPTKIVKSIVEVADTTSDERYSHILTRFYEQEHLSANMTRLVSEVFKLTRLQKGKLLLTKKAHTFLSLSSREQYVVLFNIMLGINIGYFDRHQEASCVHNSSLIMLQVLRDKERSYRTSEVYTALLIDTYPMIEDSIESLDILDYGEKNKLDIFTSIAETRLFERLYLPLGLVTMNPAKYPDADTFASSELLNSFITEKHAINKELLFCKKLVKSLQDEIKKE
ncbi:MAG: hypothetical protein Q9M43_07235 [Sulfurimonas sp.]|nr:hypothetical protein [Sulfurimonas sp.]